MTDHAAIAAMLRKGATYRQINATLGAHPKTIRDVRAALGIPVPEGRGGTRRDAVRDQIAAMLHDGATAEQIGRRLRVSSHMVTEVRQDRSIPLPPGRGGGHAPDTALRDQIAALLQDGATYDQIQEQTGAGTTTIARVRKDRAIPLPHGRHNHRTHTPDRTPEQALAHYSQPTPDGQHTDWTGPTQGRRLPVIWSHGRYNALHLAFRLHHGRDPHGRVNRSCTHPGCITGAHLTDRRLREADRRLREANRRADTAFAQIFGTTS
ncbi:Trp family transcriptional regulator [Streptomyces europaeiscabiei]|uniref:Trp family transcriptional regulator n=1 Tax=Streptomyces europaeiscabiei TaxID=146819 RepID=UPI0029ACCB2E|nr:Trp family transcriptional regulator [Streptomyces europaeiscabiei]MDX3629027.1 Trp family transcriptional regulator [Streptomyces europaeiscabiei]MDX3647355.1 Trp family transcriptional regulator [Streptomyces europaeiscabiei]